MNVRVETLRDQECLMTEVIETAVDERQGRRYGLDCESDDSVKPKGQLQLVPIKVS